MSIDPRLIDIGTTADEREPVAVYEDQVTVIVDNLMAAYWRDPRSTDTMLRRDGHVRTADRLVEVFGPHWWEQLQTKKEG
ncbi:hypothetical protein [Streptomyces sp. NBC_01794]|uniref:hypothetical protein n=1 Tax=Streptomyces sp. NBC_01794 TaxID=2975942 RepID=UPI003092D95B|nr:hypothetical protein OIE54_11900 [Streptomyces sp. NBC_01794]